MRCISLRPHATFDLANNRDAGYGVRQRGRVSDPLRQRKSARKESAASPGDVFHNANTRTAGPNSGVSGLRGLADLSLSGGLIFLSLPIASLFLEIALGKRSGEKKPRQSAAQQAVLEIGRGEIDEVRAHA